MPVTGKSLKNGDALIKYNLMITIKEEANNYAEKHGFRVPYNGTNDYYDKVDVKASFEGFEAGAKFVQEWHSIEKLPKEGKILLMYDNDPDRVASGYIDQYYKPCGHWIGHGWKKATHFRMINMK